MRFRRETGDFGIIFTIDGETNKLKDIQLPKGLSGEDLLGVAIKMPGMGNNGIKLSAITTVFDDDGVVNIMLGNNPQNRLYYDSTTGILSANVPTPPEPQPEPEPEEEEAMTFRSAGQDSNGNPMYEAIQTYTLPNFHNGDPVKIYSADGSGLLYSGTISRIGEISNDTVVSGTVGQSVTVPAGTLKLTITYDANGEERTDNNIYWNSSNGRVGHAFVVLRSSGSGGSGGSQTK